MSTDPIELHITVVAAGDHSGGFALTNEIELVKAALLYADRVTLASPRASMVSMIGALSSLTGADRTGAVLQLAEAMPDAHEFHELYTTLKHKKHKTREELLTLKALERAVSKAGDQLSAKAFEIASDAGLIELLPAIEHGVLDLDPLGVDEGDTDVMVERMSALIAEIVAPGSTTMPMLDNGSGDLLKAMLKEEMIPQARLQPLTQASVAGQFISWVPAFPDTDVESVLDAREVLRDPLVRYRSAVIRLSKELQDEPMSPDFGAAVIDLYRRDVQPALTEIEEISKQLGLRSALGTAARTGTGRRIAEAAIGFAAATVTDLPPVIVSALGISLDVAAEVARDRSAAQRSMQQNQFFFLYESDRVLMPRT